MNPFQRPLGLQEGLAWGLWWSPYISRVSLPLITLAFVFGARRGSSACLSVLGVLLIVMVTSRLFFTVHELQAIRAHVAVCPLANLPRCTAPCSCGCGHTLETVPKTDCGKPCACGCTRSCVVHEGHRGECGGS